MAPNVSICIASFRRPRGLGRLLDSLARLKLPSGLAVEIIVVDNDAAGSAAAVVEARTEVLSHLRYLVEPRQNIAHARNLALSEARGEWVMFVDDDEEVNEDWLAGYMRLFDRVECDGAFGPVLPRLERVGASWLDVDTFYTRPRHFTGAPLAARDLRTSNAMLRRHLFEDRRFDPRFGRTGGSDSELFGRMSRSGARFLWCDDAPVIEFVPPERHRLGWLARRAFRGGWLHTRLQISNGRAGVLRSCAKAVLILGSLTLTAPLGVLGGRRALARIWLRICTQAGHLWSLAGRSFEEYAPARYP